MNLHRDEFERLRAVLAAADQPLTAREILARLEERGEADAFDSAHRVATVLGQRARTGVVEVVQDRPYRYRLVEG